MLDFTYFKEKNKLIAIGLKNEQAPDADTKAIQQINFAENLDRVKIKQYFSLLKKQKKLFQIFQKNNRIVKKQS